MLRKQQVGGKTSSPRSQSQCPQGLNASVREGVCPMVPSAPRTRSAIGATLILGGWSPLTCWSLRGHQPFRRQKGQARKLVKVCNPTNPALSGPMFLKLQSSSEFINFFYSHQKSFADGKMKIYFAEFLFKLNVCIRPAGRGPVMKQPRFQLGAPGGRGVGRGGAVRQAAPSLPPPPRPADQAPAPPRVAGDTFQRGH